MNDAPKVKLKPVVEKGQFPFAAVGLDHNHIYGQCSGLIEAGAELRYVYDPDPEKVENFVRNFPQVIPTDRPEKILDSPEIRLVASATVPSERASLGFRVMEADKDYFTDKTPFTDFTQLEKARKKTRETGRKYMVYYSERLHVECAIYAGDLIDQGEIGDVVQVIGFGPHRLGVPDKRPNWFYEKEKYGGILTDIGSHQCEQFLHYAGAQDATVTNARVENFNHSQYPEFEDFGEASLVANNGVSFYYRVDWFTPDGLRTWGDGRTFVLGTDGYIELRKYVDISTKHGSDQLYLVNREGEKHFQLHNKVGYPFFGRFIIDCLERSERAMTQEHAFKAAELSLECQRFADQNRLR